MLKGGKRTKGVVRLGDRIAEFKSFIEAEDVRLKGLWEQWAAVQTEFDRLGDEIFGIDDNGLARTGRFKSDIEELDVQHQTAVAVITSEASSVCEQSLKNMKASERGCTDPLRRKNVLTTLQELDIQVKKDQESLLRSLLFV